MVRDNSKNMNFGYKQAHGFNSVSITLFIAFHCCDHIIHSRPIGGLSKTTSYTYLLDLLSNRPLVYGRP